VDRGYAGYTRRLVMPARVLVVDDQVDLAETLADGLTDLGFDAVASDSSASAAAQLANEPFDALVTDLRMPEVDGMGLLARSRAIAPERPVIVMTAYAAVETAVEAIRQGAYHYLTKPFAVNELALFLSRALDDAGVRREARALRAAMRDESSLAHWVAASAAMREVLDRVTLVSGSSVPVLLVGETGTGKTALARAIHTMSPRASGPFVAINCAAIPDALLESELFGHVRGAFTGATSARAGLFAEAHGGTILLDEVGEMSPPLQAKLLHVLESGTVRPVGAGKERAVDVRIVAATHRDLHERARAGAFREDLVYRLDVVSIDLPPLRHRREDVPLLVEQLMARARAKHTASRGERLSPGAMAAILTHAWPGNVRELAHALERAVVLARNAEIGVAELPGTVTATAHPPAAPATPFEGPVLPIREMQRRYAAWALDSFGGHKTRTAEALGVDAKTLAKWLAGDEK
jgi:two-component system response regulator HydG